MFSLSASKHRQFLNSSAGKKPTVLPPVGTSGLFSFDSTNVITPPDPTNVVLTSYNLSTWTKTGTATADSTGLVGFPTSLDSIYIGSSTNVTTGDTVTITINIEGTLTTSVLVLAGGVPSTYTIGLTVDPRVVIVTAYAQGTGALQVGFKREAIDFADTFKVNSIAVTTNKTMPVPTFSRNSMAYNPFTLLPAPHNDLKYSEALNTAPWTATGATVVVTGVTSTITFTTVSGSVSQLSSSTSQAVGLFYTASVWLWGSGTTQIKLTDGVANSTLTVNLTPISTRYTITMQYLNSIKPAPTFSINRNITGSDTVNVYGAQLNIGQTVLPYLKTEASIAVAPRYVPGVKSDAILIERSSTQLLPTSNNFQTMLKTEVTVSTGATAPDGTASASIMYETVTNAQHSISTNTVTTTAALSYAGSVYLKRLSTTSRIYAKVEWRHSGGLIGNAVINLVTGSVESSSGGIFYVEIAANGWLKVSAVVTAPSTAMSFLVYSLFDSVTDTFAGSTTNGVMLYGAQVEQGKFSTSYMHNVTSSTITRFYDYLIFNPTLLLTATAGTIAGWVYVIQAKTNSGELMALFSHRNVSANNALYIYILSNTVTFLTSTAAGASTSTSYTNGLTGVVSWAHIAATWNSSEAAVWVNGVKTPTPTATPNIPAAIGTTCEVAYDSTYANSHITTSLDQLRFYQRVLSAAEIKQLYLSRR